MFDREGRLRHVNSRFADVWPGSEERFAPGAGLDRIVAAVMDRASHEHCSGASKKEIAARIENPGDDVVEIELSVAGRVLSCRATRTDSGGTMLTFRRDERRPEAGATRDGLAAEILNSVAGQMPGLIARIDLDGRYVYASRSYSDWS